MQRNILIVDDDEDDCDLFIDAAHIVDNELAIEKVFTCGKALELLGKGYHPDFIFLDLNMPMIDGGTCLQEIRKMSALENVPVIIYSTSKRKTDVNRLMVTGADYFVTKPYTLKELCHEITLILSTAGRPARNSN